MSKKELPWLKKALSFPDSPGVYQFFDQDGNCLYVGKAASLRQRIKAYLNRSSSLSEKERIIQEKAVDVSFTVTNNIPEALILESTLVKDLQPMLNVKLKDDKRFPYLKVSLSEPFPRLSIVRYFKKDGNRYFGPFTEAKALRRTLRTIKEIFGIPSCRVAFSSQKVRAPCLEYQIKHCLGPCAGLISREDYQDAVREMLLFLEGKTLALQGYLENKMKEESRNLNFEAAAKIRDQLFALKKIMKEQTVFSQVPINRDVVAWYFEEGTGCMTILNVREGKLIGSDHFILLQTEGEEQVEIQLSTLTQYYEKAQSIPPEIIVQLKPDAKESLKRWLEIVKGLSVSLPQPRGQARKQLEIAQNNAREHLQTYLKTSSFSASSEGTLKEIQLALGLSKVPFSIEGYDISNFGPKEAVGAKVLFINARKDTSGYRHYRIKLEGQDDYGMIKEVLTRRFSSPEKKPDLILIDGGKGHLNAALEVLDNLAKGTDVISLAKEKEEIFSPQFSEPIVLQPNSPALQLLQRVRDEAHRFANTYHRKLRSRKIKKSRLEEIPGIGPEKKALLLKSFGSLGALERASFLEIATVPGIGEKTAKKIYTYLHEKLDEKR